MKRPFSRILNGSWLSSKKSGSFIEAPSRGKRKRAAWALLLGVCLLNAGCTRIATPEELIRPPELSKDRREIQQMMDKLLPKNAEFVPLSAFKEVEAEAPYSRASIGQEKEKEIITFYRDKESQMLTMLILKQQDGAWGRLADLALESTNISQYIVSDLDADGTDEIIIGTDLNHTPALTRRLKIIGMNQGRLQLLGDYSHIVSQVADINKDRRKEIVSATQEESGKGGAVIKVLNLEKGKLVKKTQIALRPGLEPHALALGAIYPGSIGVFVDSIVREVEEKTEIFRYTGTELKKIVLQDPRQQFGLKPHPVPSENVDADDVIEIGFPVVPPYGINAYRPTQPWVKAYYKVRPDHTLQLARQVYENEGLSILFKIPESFFGRYLIESYQDDKRVIFRFLDEKNQPVPLLEIKSIPKNIWKQSSEVIQPILETPDAVIGGKVEDHSARLSPKDKELYLKMRSDIATINNVVKIKGYK